MKALLTRAVAASALLAVFAAPVLAADFEVHMKNKGTDGNMVFEPGFIKIAPGDTVNFVPVDKGHNAETVPGLLPAGAQPFKGKMSEKISVKFDVAGAYAVKCMPHVGMGMIALVVVGDKPANIDAIKAAKLPKMARDRLDKEISAAGL